MPHASRSASQPELTALFSSVQQHFQDVIVPLWQGPGWNADMALPYEALDAEHQPLPRSATGPWPARGSCTCFPA
jgi:mannose-6-phosphate isomerase